MANTIKNLGPLDWKAPIVDEQGRPSPDFQRRWQFQIQNNANIPTKMAQLLFVQVTVATAVPGSSMVNFGPSGLRSADSALGYEANGWVTQAYGPGELATVLIPIQEIDGTWVQGDEYWLSTGGAITNVPPTSGYAQSVGKAHTATALIFHPKEMVSPL